MVSGDFARLREIARAEFDLPDLGSSSLLAKRVVESGQQIIAGAAARVMVEALFWIDPQWESPRWRMEAFKLLHQEMRQELKDKGIAEAHAWLPPEIERPFGRRLIQLGWQRPVWKGFFLEIA